MNANDLRDLFTDEDAVSPVIGVILMVAITVILAAVIGTFVLGLGDQVTGSTAPTADFTIEYSNLDDANNQNDKLTVTHDGGDSISKNQLTVNVGGTDASTLSGYSAFPSSDVTAGDSASLDEGGSNNHFGSGDSVRIVWESDDGGSSQTISQSEAP